MNSSNRRLLQIFAFLAAWALVIVARLAQVQLMRHDEYVVRAQRQQERTVSLEPVRGSILDRKGRVLAESVAAVSLYADPQAIVDSAATARALAKIPAIDLSADEIEEKLTANGGVAGDAGQVALEAGGAVCHVPPAGS